MLYFLLKLQARTIILSSRTAVQHSSIDMYYWSHLLQSKFIKNVAQPEEFLITKEKPKVNVMVTINQVIKN